MSDVYSVGRDRWCHYDDRRVSCVDEADVLGEGPQRNGYIFCLLKKLCSQVVSMERRAPDCDCHRGALSTGSPRRWPAAEHLLIAIDNVLFL